ncbi:MAG: LamG domain-containing protein [Candidatus Nealsonbacteria bacterium]|nr:LamG domain-containing protein [Candidatus Nealsonbacteria bacterium]
MDRALRTLRQHWWVVGVLTVAFLWFGRAVARGDEVQTLTSWTTGLSGPDRNSSGSNRLLIFTVGMEASADQTIVSASFGGQPLKQVITTVTGSSYVARAYIFYLDEAAIQAATSNTFSVIWSGSVDDVCYAARIYGNVDQGFPIRDSQQAGSASSTPNPISTPALTVQNGDYVAAAAQCGNARTYTWYGGFVEGTDQTAASSDHSTADLAVSSSGTVAASARNSGPNRQVILAAVLSSVGMIGHWQFDEGIGIDALDSSGNGNDGTLAGGTDWVAARCGYAVELDGFEDRVDLGQVELGTSAYTVGAWFKTGSGRQQTIVAATKAGTSDQLMLVDVESNGTVRFLHRYPTGAAGGTEIFSTGTYGDDGWHHVTAVKSPTTLTLHVDGQQVAQAADTTGVESLVDMVAGTSSKLGGQDNFKGTLDEIRLYGSALSPTEASALYGMVGYWRLDESAGSTAPDCTNFANDGSLQGPPVWRPDSGTVGGALEFDGRADYVSVTSSSTLQMTDSLTIAAWIKGDRWRKNSYVNVIVRKGEGNPNNYQLAIADGTVALYLDGSDTAGFRGNTILSKGQWYHVAGTWDGSTVRIYVDGVLDNDPPAARSGSIGADDRDLYIGGRSGTDLFDGMLDDVRVYNRALCDDEIERLHGAALPKKGWRIKSWVEIDKPGG